MRFWQARRTGRSSAFDICYTCLQSICSQYDESSWTLLTTHGHFPAVCRDTVITVWSIFLRFTL